MAALFGDTLSDMRELLEHRRRQRGYRPKCDRWCKQCGRKHNPRDVCELYLREKINRHDRKVRVWAP